MCTSFETHKLINSKNVQVHSSQERSFRNRKTGEMEYQMKCDLREWIKLQECTILFICSLSKTAKAEAIGQTNRSDKQIILVQNTRATVQFGPGRTKLEIFNPVIVVRNQLQKSKYNLTSKVASMVVFINNAHK